MQQKLHIFPLIIFTFEQFLCFIMSTDPLDTANSLEILQSTWNPRFISSYNSSERLPNSCLNSFTDLELVILAEILFILKKIVNWIEKSVIVIPVH